MANTTKIAIVGLMILLVVVVAKFVKNGSTATNDNGENISANEGSGAGNGKADEANAGGAISDGAASKAAKGPATRR